MTVPPEVRLETLARMLYEERLEEFAGMIVLSWDELDDNGKWKPLYRDFARRILKQARTGEL